MQTRNKIIKNKTKPHKVVDDDKENQLAHELLPSVTESINNIPVISYYYKEKINKNKH